MFEKFMNKNAGRAALLSTLSQAHSALEQRKCSLATQIAALQPLEPGDRLIECAAYLAQCADHNTVPDYLEAIKLRFAVTDRTLSAALRDAIKLRWVTQLPTGALVWPGKTPLADLAAKRGGNK